MEVATDLLDAQLEQINARHASATDAISMAASSRAASVPHGRRWLSPWA